MLPEGRGTASQQLQTASSTSVSATFDSSSSSLQTTPLTTPSPHTFSVRESTSVLYHTPCIRFSPDTNFQHQPSSGPVRHAPASFGRRDIRWPFEDDDEEDDDYLDSELDAENEHIELADVASASKECDEQQERLRNSAINVSGEGSEVQYVTLLSTIEVRARLDADGILESHVRKIMDEGIVRRVDRVLGTMAIQSSQMTGVHGERARFCVAGDGGMEGISATGTCEKQRWWKRVSQRIGKCFRKQ